MSDLTERKFQTTKPEIAPGAQCIPNSERMLASAPLAYPLVK